MRDLEIGGRPLFRWICRGALETALTISGSTALVWALYCIMPFYVSSPLESPPASGIAQNFTTGASVYFCLFFFFGFVDLVVFLGSWWPLKAVIFLGLTAACFFVPSSFFPAYAIICIVGGILFLIIQTILILDFAYDWAERYPSLTLVPFL